MPNKSGAGDRKRKRIAAIRDRRAQRIGGIRQRKGQGLEGVADRRAQRRSDIADRRAQRVAGIRQRKGQQPTAQGAGQFSIPDIAGNMVHFSVPGGGQAQAPFLPGLDVFPDKTGFRMGTFRILEEFDDYLVCRGFDPNAKDPFSQVTPAAPLTVHIAKPPLLTRTPWDGVDPVSIGGVDYTFEYDDDFFGVRTAFWTDDEGEDQEREETIDIPYFEGDLILAVEVSMNSFLDGMKVNGTKIKNENGALISWVDLNFGGRHWAGPSAAECPDRNEIHHITIIGTPTGGTFDLNYNVNGAIETLTFNYDDTSAEVSTVLAGHSEITAADVNVSGDGFPSATMQIEFRGELEATAISLPTADWSALTGGSGVAIIASRPQSGHPN